MTMALEIGHTNSDVVTRGCSNVDPSWEQYLRDSGGGFECFDMNVVSQREYEKARSSGGAHMDQYQMDGVGHYNPRGNHFFGYAIKDKLGDLLDPKPLPYWTTRVGWRERSTVVATCPARAASAAARAASLICGRSGAGSCTVGAGTYS